MEFFASQQTLQGSTAHPSRARCGIDFAASSETRFASGKQLTELDSEDTIFWSGKAEEEWREAGVGFAVRSSLLDKIERPVVLSGCIMTMEIPLAGGSFSSLIPAYAPTLTTHEKPSTFFYQALRKTVTGILKNESVLIFGDLNARVGLDNNIWKPICSYGT